MSVVGPPLVLRAPAKLTVSLRITGRRNDGYHLIDAEMTTLDLSDELILTARSADELTADLGAGALTASGPFAAGMPLDGSNLVAKALLLTARNRDVDVHIVKRIPHGGGLGGASTDAAAILRWAGHLDVAAAATLGADVPFCLVGGRARVRGIGEMIEPLPSDPAAYTLVIPPLSVSTPAAYKAWDELGGPHGDAGNDLEPAAIAVVPEMAVWRDRIAEAAGVRPTLAGSGATWFIPSGRPDLAQALPDATVVVAGSG